MTRSRVLKQQKLNKWDFPWEEMDVLIGGKSSIDLPELSIRGWDDATAFVRNYGYDPNSREDQRTIQAILIEAINFIEQHLLSHERHQYPIPPKLVDCEDVRQLILWASGFERTTKRLKLWACAVLRVAHTIAHIEGVHRRVAISLARHQIMERFDHYVFRTSDGRLWLGDQVHYVELESLEWKNEKARESMVLKLLHKKANVAETIFDLLGVRIVTKRLCDVMLAVKFLRQFYMITFPNCNPGRARNNLVDTASFRRNSEMLKLMLEEDRIGLEEFDDLLEQLTSPAQSPTSVNNPHTQSAYKAVQLTCRQLIRSDNPMLGWLDKLEEWQLSHDNANLDHILEFIKSSPGVVNSRKLAVFFPFEVQIMDAETHRANQFGDAAHDRYKESQLRAARRRVLGDVMKMKKESIKT